ncbi:phospholipase D-like domain-containing protein, partial [Priestia sp. SIMBA_032]
LVTAYEFTSWPVAKALVAAKDNGVKVAVVVDAKENASKKASKVQYLVSHGIPVRQDNRRDMIHDKNLTFGSGAVELGSFNFTAAAASAKHAENAVVLRHVPSV